MGKEVATINSVAANVLAQFDQGKNPFLDAAAGDTEFFGQFLKFSGNTGEYTFGEDDSELEPGSLLLSDMTKAMHGWICWVDGEVVEERNVNIASGERFPTKEELPDHGPYEKYEDGTEDGWQEQYILYFYSEDLEQAFTFKTSSASGRRAVRKFLKAYGQKAVIKIGDDGLPQVVVIEIDNTSFPIKGKDGKVNRKAGKKFAPVFKIVDWADYSEVGQFFAAADSDGEDEDDYEQDEQDEPDDKPARGRRSAKDDDEDAGDDDDNGSDADDEQDDKPARGSGRRTRVRHAPPQDEEDEPTKEEARGSARGRRGRRRD